MVPQEKVEQTEKEYKAPRLLVYGDINQVTLAGTIGLSNDGKPKGSSGMDFFVS